MSEQTRTIKINGRKYTLWARRAKLISSSESSTTSVHSSRDFQNRLEISSSTDRHNEVWMRGEDGRDFSVNARGDFYDYGFRGLPGHELLVVYAAAGDKPSGGVPFMIYNLSTGTVNNGAQVGDVFVKSYKIGPLQMASRVVYSLAWVALGYGLMFGHAGAGETPAIVTNSMLVILVGVVQMFINYGRLRFIQIPRFFKKIDRAGRDVINEHTKQANV